MAIKRVKRIMTTISAKARNYVNDKNLFLYPNDGGLECTITGKISSLLDAQYINKPGVNACIDENIHNTIAQLCQRQY